MSIIKEPEYVSLNESVKTLMFFLARGNMELGLENAKEMLFLSIYINETRLFVLIIVV